MRRDISPAVLLEVAVAAAVGLYTGYGLSNKVNRLAQAEERIALVLERANPVRPQAVKRDPLADSTPCEPGKRSKVDGLTCSERASEYLSQNYYRTLQANQVPK